MEYNKIISVAGLPGLYELINSKADGAIIRSLDDKSTRFASNRIHNFSHLESIEVYTIRENVNLADVFWAMEKAGATLPDTKDNATTKKYFEKVFPDIDFERVYNSDLKKMVKWYEVLKKNNIEIKLSEPEQEEVAETEEVVEPAKKEKKEESPKKPTKKKTAKKEVEEEKKPAKKTAKSDRSTGRKKGK